MEFRWLSPEEQRARAVETNSLAEVLSLAQKLQAEGEVLVSEEQAVEMGRELGVQPEYVREALRLSRRSPQPQPHPHAEPISASADHGPRRTILSAAMVGFGVGTLPLALDALARSHAEPLALFVLMAALFAGWSARLPRLAEKASAVAAPAVILASSLYPSPFLSPEAFFFAVLSFTPLSATVGRAAAAVRRRAERLAEPQRLTTSRP
jgi:hypothetical protein